MEKPLRNEKMEEIALKPAYGTDSLHLKQRYHFAPDDIDAVLYGCIRIGPSVDAPVHSLSGIQFGSSNGFKGPYSHWTPVSMPLQTDSLYPNFPLSLCLRQLRMGHLFQKGVFCKNEIKKGTRFGPYLGVHIGNQQAKERDSKFLWEVFEADHVKYFIDGYYEESNWMKVVNCARFTNEQNLEVVQIGYDLYYETKRDIKPGEELLVWYGPNYDQYMDLPMSLVKEVTENKEDYSKEDVGTYPCDRCGKVFAYEYYRDKHLKYTKCVDQGNRKFPCDQCPRSFEKRDRLRIHILHVHQKHRPHECPTCGKKFSQSSSLNKHQRVHSGERPYKCNQCSKAFTASSILRTHLRQHSGERPFKCVHCGKAFASHAAHDSHVRRTHTKQKPCVCETCGKAFAQAYELKFHMNIHTGKKPYSCNRCGRCFSSPSSRDRHRLHFDCLNKGQKPKEDDDENNNKEEAST